MILKYPASPARNALCGCRDALSVATPLNVKEGEPLLVVGLGWGVLVAVGFGTGVDVGVTGIEGAPRRMLIVSLPEFATARSRVPSPLKSPVMR